MPYFIAKPVVLELQQWRKNGDMPHDGVINNINSGAVVGRYVSPTDKATQVMVCSSCGQPLSRHGLLMATLKKVCPGDWIQTIRDSKKNIVGYDSHTHEYVTTQLVVIPPQLKVKETAK